MKNWRINTIQVMMIVFSAGLIGRLFCIQVQQADLYKALAQGLHNLPQEEELIRGEVFFRDGEPLAVNSSFSLVFASPPKVDDCEKSAKALSEILNLPEDSILEKLKKDTLYSPIKNKLSEKEVELLKNAKLAGIFITQEDGRYYPKETLGSKVIGFLGAQGSGQYGLEEYYNEILKGESLGSDLILTIDYGIQYKAEELLEAAKENLSIEGGQIIVMDPTSGKIIALSNLPNFDPNRYEEYASEGNLEIFQNGATQKIFEPGSVFKPITMATALNEGLITPQTKYTDEGQVKIGGYTVFNYDNRTWGQRTMTEVLEKSINTGAVFVEKLIPHNVFLDYIDKFGFFEPSGIDLPETEIYSQNQELKKGYEINFATASFGQGIEMTPIQLVRAYSAIANGGKLVKPYLVDKILDNDKTTETQPEISASVISSSTASQVTAMLVSVVENGYAKSARIPGYYIAGKTGTAQVPEEGGYSSERTIQSFIGFAPAFNPQFLIMIKLDNPKTKTAEYSAVPIFHDLAEYIVHYWQIPPDYE